MAGEPPARAGADRPLVLPPLAASLDVAVAVLQSGGLVAFPTETVYGLGADAASSDAVRRIFQTKGRPPDHPLIVHLGSAELLADWTTAVPPPARDLAAAFWPGPLTLVLPRPPRVVPEATGGRATVGLRVPDQPLTLGLLRRFGGGVAAPSANRFGRVSPTTADHVAAELGADVDVILDGGACSVGVESTIVEFEGHRAVILRPGGVAAEAIEEVLGAPVERIARGPARAPGMLASHYAPSARVVLADDAAAAARLVEEATAEGLRVAVLAEGPVPDLPEGTLTLAPVDDPAGYARNLYARLREADAAGAAVVVAVLPAAHGIGVAVRDRLMRAAHRGG